LIIAYRLKQKRRVSETMTNGHVARFKQALERLFPERHLYVRSDGELKSLVLTPKRQMAIASALLALGLWLGVATASMAINALSLSNTDREVAKTQAKYERWIADRQARLNSAVAQINANNGSIDQLASTVEKRHAALAQLMGNFKGVPGAEVALAPSKSLKTELGVASPMDRVQAVSMDQDCMITRAESFAKTRADRLRLAFRLAGLNPVSYADRNSSASSGLGGPLIEAKDPRALAAVLDVDEDFAERIQSAANNMDDMRALNRAAERLPFARPTNRTPQSSGFGVRFDPFTRRPAFHSGLDFTGGFMTPIQSTAPGIVSFTGIRSGYGKTVEIDHGAGFKTRYAHLQSISVNTGQRVGVGQRLGGMGSTGRSTGVHLHYEVWVNGRAQNPNRFVKAGDYVQQAG
jgi:murein DD-endopeptidase MepM/ murein hydrolase activator NlpD